MDAAVQTAPTPLAQRRQRRRVWLGALALGLLLIALVVLAWWLLYARYYESTDDAYVTGDLVNVTSQVSGTVVAISADEDDRVQAGQELIRLDDTDARIALQDAEQQLARTVRQTRTLFSNRDPLLAGVAQRRAARDALTAAEKNLAASLALVGRTGVADHPEVQAAATQVERAWLSVVRTSVHAPVSGYLARRSVQLGERIAPGSPLMAVVPLERLWVEANFKEVQLNRMRIGQAVNVVTDLYGSDVVFHGRVAGLGMGTGAAFALLPAQNATGNWIKVVQRVPVRVTLPVDELRAHPLRIGLSSDARVDLHDSTGPQLAQRPPAAPVLATSAYDIDRGPIKARIVAIIAENTRAAAEP